MRLFQQQLVYNAFDNPTPAPPPPPPFLTDEEEEKSLSLLRESTTHLREGRQRLPTPDRVAIMELSSSFEKRRLGKQQQILSEITQRCREQEVTDLSAKISAKVDLKRASADSNDSLSFYTASKTPHRRNIGPFSDVSLSTGELRDLQAIEKRLNFEKGYKYFPARKIMRQPSRLQLIQTTTAPAAITTARSGGGGGGGGGSYRYRDVGSTAPGIKRINIDFLKGMRSSDSEARAQILERQTINGSIQLQHYIQPKLDAMAPLMLPDVHGLDSGYQDRIDSYFSSSRLALQQRNKTFYDASSISGRSFRSLYTGSRPTGSRHQIKSMRSERGPHNLLQQINDDVGVGLGETEIAEGVAAGEGGGAEGGGGNGGEVPMDLKSSSQSALRAESQKVVDSC